VYNLEVLETILYDLQNNLCFDKSSVRITGMSRRIPPRCTIFLQNMSYECVLELVKLTNLSLLCQFSFCPAVVEIWKQPMIK